MNAEADTGAQDPQTLDRVSLQGTANEVLRIDVGYDAIRATYLQCFPAATLTMSLGDFAETAAGRFVAGFGQIFTLTKESLQAAAYPTRESTEDQ